MLDQFCNTSHFVSNGELISLQEADGTFELKEMIYRVSCFADLLIGLAILFQMYQGLREVKGEAWVYRLRYGAGQMT